MIASTVHVETEVLSYDIEQKANIEIGHPSKCYGYTASFLFEVCTFYWHLKTCLN